MCAVLCDYNLVFLFENSDQVVYFKVTYSSCHLAGSQFLLLLVFLLRQLELYLTGCEGTLACKCFTYTAFIYSSLPPSELGYIHVFS